MKTLGEFSPYQARLAKAEQKGKAEIVQEKRNTNSQKKETKAPTVTTDSYQTNLTPRTNAKLFEGLDMKKINMLMDSHEREQDSGRLFLNL